MKLPAPELQNTRILRLATPLILLPIAFIAGACRWVKCLIQKCKPDKVQHEKEQAHQARIRRELRGLPPDHVQKSPPT